MFRSFSGIKLKPSLMCFFDSGVNERPDFDGILKIGEVSYSPARGGRGRDTEIERRETGGEKRGEGGRGEREVQKIT